MDAAARDVRFPSPLAGEGVMRSMTDEGSARKRPLAPRRPERAPCGATPHPTGFAGHLPPQGGEGTVGGVETRAECARIVT